MNFSEVMFYENYLTSDFHTNTVISRRVCLLVKMASKTVIRPIISLADSVQRTEDDRRAVETCFQKSELLSAFFLNIYPEVQLNDKGLIK